MVFHELEMCEKLCVLANTTNIHVIQI